MVSLFADLDVVLDLIIRIQVFLGEMLNFSALIVFVGAC